MFLKRSPPDGPRLPRFALAATCVLLIGTNIFPLWRNSVLRAAAHPAAETIKPGDTVANFHAVDKNGFNTEVNLRAESSKRVLFYFRSNCPFCQLQVEQWKALAEKLNPEKYRVLAITPEKEFTGIKDFTERNGVGEWDILRISPEDAIRAKLAVTPITFVVDENGIVEKSWVGLWKPQDLAQVEEFFGIRLSS